MKTVETNRKHKFGFWLEGSERSRICNGKWGLFEYPGYDKSLNEYSKDDCPYPKEEVIQWLNEQTNNDWYWDSFYGGIFFKIEDDAVAFKLMWE